MPNITSKCFSIPSYGRRKHRVLSKKKQTLFTDTLPQFVVKDLNVLLTIAKNFQEVHLEIGFGNGEFLLKNAILNPKNLYLGCEPYINGVVRAVTKIKELKNIIRNL